MIYSDAPTLFQFNYLIVAVPDNQGNHVLLDATDQYLPAGYIPQRAVNGLGRIITEEESQWVALENPGIHNVRKTYRMKLNHDGSLEGTFEYQYHQLARHLIVEHLQVAGNSQAFTNLKAHLQSPISEPSVTIPEDLNQPIMITGSLELNEVATKVHNELFFPLLLFETMNEGTFRQDERRYPIHFDYQEMTQVNIILELPEGMEVVHLPKNQIIRWGNNMIFEFSTGYQEGILTLKGGKVITVREVPAKNYPHAKKFFDLIMQKYQEQIVLSASSI